jgi:hypothetical protein
MFTLEGPHIVMSRTDAQNGLDFHFNFNHFFIQPAPGEFVHGKANTNFDNLDWLVIKFFIVNEKYITN